MKVCGGQNGTMLEIMVLKALFYWKIAICSDSSDNCTSVIKLMFLPNVFIYITATHFAHLHPQLDETDPTRVEDWEIEG